MDLKLVNQKMYFNYVFQKINTTGKEILENIQGTNKMNRKQADISKKEDQNFKDILYLL